MISTLVDTAVRAEVLRQTVKEVRMQNVDLTENQTTKLTNEAVAWARANPA